MIRLAATCRSFWICCARFLSSDMRTRRLSVKLGLVCTGVLGGCACTVAVVGGGGAELLGGEDMGVQAAGVVGPVGCVGPESMLMIEWSMCERAAWMYSSCVSGRLTVISSVRRI